MSNLEVQLNLLAKISEDLTEAARSGQIGIPRFIRWTQPAGILNDFDIAQNLCNRLFGSTPVRSDEFGSDPGQTRLLIWTTGESAILAQSSNTPDSLPEVMLLGSAGAIYFDGSGGVIRTLEEVVR